MKKLFFLATALSLTATVFGAQLGSSFTYQGQLNLVGVPVGTPQDFEFGLYDDSIGGNQIGTTNTLPAVAITNGLFSVPLDFGTGAFGTQSRYLHIAVRPSGDPGAFISLSPRTAVMPSPVALSVAASGVNTDSIADGSVIRAKISDFGQYYSGVWTSNEFVFLPALSLPQTLFNKGIGAGPTISQSGIYNVRIKLKWLTQFSGPSTLNLRSNGAVVATLESIVFGNPFQLTTTEFNRLLSLPAGPLSITLDGTLGRWEAHATPEEPNEIEIFRVD